VYWCHFVIFFTYQSSSDVTNPRISHPLTSYSRISHPLTSEATGLIQNEHLGSSIMVTSFPFYRIFFFTVDREPCLANRKQKKVKFSCRPIVNKWSPAGVTTQGNPRFVTVNEEEFLDILKNKDSANFGILISANTQRSTEKCVKVFKA